MVKRDKRQEEKIPGDEKLQKSQIIMVKVYVKLCMLRAPSKNAKKRTAKILCYYVKHDFDRAVYDRNIYDHKCY